MAGGPQTVERAVDPSTATIQYVRVDHRGLDVLVPQEFLDGSDVVAVLQQMGCKGMTKCVGGHALGQPSPIGRLMDRLLNHRFVEMVTMPDARPSVEVVGRSRKNPLPAPLAVGIGVLSGQRVRQGRLPQPALQIGFVLLAHASQVVLERLEQSVRQHGYAILLALALSHGDFPTAEVEVLDAQPEAFEKSQPRAVQERGYQARGAV